VAVHTGHELSGADGATAKRANSEKAGNRFDGELTRHANGDWGEVDEHDRKANEDALEHGLRVLSAYTLRTGERIWIITEADRSSTTILLPEEY
jgi:hypothetical protein